MRIPSTACCVVYTKTMVFIITTRPQCVYMSRRYSTRLIQSLGNNICIFFFIFFSFFLLFTQRSCQNVVREKEILFLWNKEVFARYRHIRSNCLSSYSLSLFGPSLCRRLGFRFCLTWYDEKNKTWYQRRFEIIRTWLGLFLFFCSVHILKLVILPRCVAHGVCVCAKHGLSRQPATRNTKAKKRYTVYFILISFH